MNGLLEQVGAGMPPGASPTQASAPPQSAPTQSGMPGNMPADEAAAGVTPEMKAQANELSKKAIEILYGDEQAFEKMVKTFKSAKNDQTIAQAMSLIANGVIGKLEQETGPLPEPMVMSVGIVLIVTIFQDLAQGQIIEEPTEQTFTMAAAKALQDWMGANPDRADPEGVMKMAQQGQQGQSAQGQPPQGQPGQATQADQMPQQGAV